VRLPSLAPHGEKQWAVRVAGSAGCGQVIVQQLFETVVAGHLVFLAPFLMQADPATAALGEVVLHLHADDGVHAGEAVDHASHLYTSRAATGGQALQNAWTLQREVVI
jgi:hypothetical protein